MDYGVWVAEWMIRERMWSNYNIGAIGDDNQMKVALDIVLRPHNKLARDVVSRAFSHWRLKSAMQRKTCRAL
ncbi:hypothetical protein PIB30_059596 [Stylosanthes scabra]|uniref:Uncharacterized protein n=1 Tax=Stylosanthes scabra TaxID=79078 RepID=A0ABU6WII7_9FABA|nr:hypothetical protein [Stylosanthes scabra]